MNENTITTCERCGNCCIDVGRTFWKNGNYEDVDSALNDLANNGDYEDGEKPCEMLKFLDGCEMLRLKHGLAVCLIQEIYGYDAKPDVCKEHQGDERCEGAISRPDGAV